jgi:hypothetical protein
MQKPNRDSSIFEKEVINLPPIQKWLKELGEYSNKFKKYGSFLKTQEGLLKQIHEKLSTPSPKVCVFTAPPASGKTHVIALCGVYLANNGFSTCIVTPNNELKFEFMKEMNDVHINSVNDLPIITIGDYVKKRSKFEFALVDEAHNLRSAVELDDRLVKSINLEKGDKIYENVLLSLQTKEGFFARELGTETAHDILRKIKGEPYKKTARRILRTLSQWRCFVITSDTTCDLKFLSADPAKRNIIPARKLLLFSATALNKEELRFYCNIPITYFDRTNDGQHRFVPKKNVNYVNTPLGSTKEKIELTQKLLAQSSMRSLILINNNRKCLFWNKKITEESELEDRVVMIKSALNYTKRMDLYKKFISKPNGILITSSSVYWEGLNIKNLRLLIIPDVPFPKPTLLEIAERKRRAINRIARVRLIQGIGRIGRTPKTTGLCVLMFNTKGFTNLVKIVPAEKVERLVANL